MNKENSLVGAAFGNATGPIQPFPAGPSLALLREQHANLTKVIAEKEAAERRAARALIVEMATKNGLDLAVIAAEMKSAQLAELDTPLTRAAARPALRAVCERMGCRPLCPEHAGRDRRSAHGEPATTRGRFRHPGHARFTGRSDAVSRVASVPRRRVRAGRVLHRILAAHGRIFPDRQRRRTEDFRLLGTWWKR